MHEVCGDFNVCPRSWSRAKPGYNEFYENVLLREMKKFDLENITDLDIPTHRTSLSFCGNCYFSTVFFIIFIPNAAKP